MCGHMGKQIPAQNKQVCRDCDSAFWFLQDFNVVVKFCKGCKNFAPLGYFTDKPLASKCGKCRQRGKNTYLAKKGFAPVEDHDDPRTYSSVYTPGAAAIASVDQPASSSSSAATGMKRPRLESFSDSDKTDSSTSTDGSVFKFGVSPRTSAPHTRAAPGPGPYQLSAFDMLHLPTDKPTRPPVAPDRSTRTATAAKKPSINVSFDSSAVPAPVTRDPRSCSTSSSGSSSGSSGLAVAASSSSSSVSSASPSNLQDRWQWDPQSNNPLNYLAAAAFLAPPTAGAPAAASEAAAAWDAVGGAPTPLVHAAPAAAVAALDTTSDAEDIAGTANDAALPTDGTKRIAAVSSGLMALVEICCDKENTHNLCATSDDAADASDEAYFDASLPLRIPADASASIVSADVASLPTRSLPIHLPPGALVELESWAKKYAVNVRSF